MIWQKITSKLGSWVHYPKGNTYIKDNFYEQKWWFFILGEDEFEMEDEGDELLRNKNNDSGLINVTKAKIETRNSNPASLGLPPLPPDWSMQRLPNR